MTSPKTIGLVARAIDPGASWGVTLDNSDAHKDRRNKARDSARAAIKAHTECLKTEAGLDVLEAMVQARHENSANTVEANAVVLMKAFQAMLSAKALPHDQ